MKKVSFSIGLLKWFPERPYRVKEEINLRSWYIFGSCDVCVMKEKLTSYHVYA